MNSVHQKQGVLQTKLRSKKIKNLRGLLKRTVNNIRFDMYVECFSMNLQIEQLKQLYQEKLKKVMNL